MTRDEIMQLDDDALRIEVARACGYRWYYGNRTDGEPVYHLCTPFEVRGYDWREVAVTKGFYFTKAPDYPRDIAAAIALLDSTGAEYNIGKNIAGVPVYEVIIWGRNPISGPDYEATDDTLPVAACRAWLMWHSTN